MGMCWFSSSWHCLPPSFDPLNTLFRASMSAFPCVSAKLAADYTSSSQSSTCSPRHSFSSYSSSQEERPQVMDHDQSRPAQSTPPKRHRPNDAWGYDAFDAAMNRTRMENEASACEIDRGLRAFAGRSHPNQLRDLLLYITRPQTKDKANDLECLP